MGENMRGARVASLLRYLRQLVSADYIGRIQITLDFNRGGISQMAAFKLEKDPDLWRQ